MSSQILHIHHPAICTTLWLKHGLSCGLSSAFQFHHDYWVYQVYQVYIKAHTGAFCVAPDPDHPPKEPAQPDRNPGGAENCPPIPPFLTRSLCCFSAFPCPLKEQADLYTNMDRSPPLFEEHRTRQFAFAEKILLMLASSICLGIIVIFNCPFVL